eukprot:TRINITY_DN8864_c0_g1_i2.p2 TRINITY_DN8864_c0_g1~~TRINITY_DN8864_c0_g1_i2.p2  ORF type:complete len:124 (+),score=5.06 TRINITY_DN8864_c0_g1_i2:62-433(+)
MGKQPTPKLSGILDTESKAPQLSNLTKPKVLTAIAMMLGVWFGMWVAVHELQIYAIQYPLLLPLYPLIGISTIVLSTPLIMFIFNSEDFKDINPARPAHFYFLLKRVIKAINENNSKITPKNL